MRIVIFGLTISSSWGNGHAALWRSLVNALGAEGHEVVFYERDVSYYRAHRDCPELDRGAQIRFYPNWPAVRAEARATIAESDVAIVSSCCPDGRAACELVLGSPSVTRVFYDLDTPVTLSAGEDIAYLPVEGLADFDLVLSLTGGRALDLLHDRLHARKVAPLFGSVDPVHHRPTAPHAEWAGACSYLGTWSDDRHVTLDALFFETARRRPGQRFVLGGAQYPASVRWPDNVHRYEHVSPEQHAAFYCSSPITVNVTRAPLRELGFCPSMRLFEAAACGIPVLSDRWTGVDAFFTPGDQILLATTTSDADDALSLPRAELSRIGHLARERVLDEHTGAHRARQLIRHLEAAAL